MSNTNGAPDSAAALAQLEAGVHAQRDRHDALAAEKQAAGERYGIASDAVERARANADVHPDHLKRLRGAADVAEAALEQAVITVGYAKQELARLEKEYAEFADRTAEDRYQTALAAHLSVCATVNAAVAAVFDALEPELNAYLESARAVANVEKETALSRIRPRTAERQEREFPTLTRRVNVLMRLTGRVEAAMAREREEALMRNRQVAEALDNNIARINAERRREAEQQERADG